jgi:hypothetical protein
MRHTGERKRDSPPDHVARQRVVVRLPGAAHIELALALRRKKATGSADGLRNPRAHASHPIRQTLTPWTNMSAMMICIDELTAPALRKHRAFGIMGPR